jgi:fumarylacetoacetase
VIDETHDPAAVSWIAGANGHADFPLQNLPLGVFSPPGGTPRIGCAIGDRILDLAAASEAGLLPATLRTPLSGETLNALFARPALERRALRRAVFALAAGERPRQDVAACLREAEGCALHLPARIGDYTDFYVGIHHATNVGRLFRPDSPLLPNYKHLPIGYHGRASSVRPSGAPVRRPRGQLKPPESQAPVFAPSRRLDYELELGLWVGPGNELGEPIPMGEACEHMAGLCLLNDWSARDIQTWEYQPLGPFLAKSFHTTVSPWVVTMEALAPFRKAPPPRPDGDPPPLPYLTDEADQVAGALGLELEVFIATGRMRQASLTPFRLSRGDTSGMYWTLAQILVHHASNGCNLAAGDLLGTGTLSTADSQGFGSLLELTHNGAEPIALPSGEARAFLEDGDEVIFTARARAPGRVPIGFGACRGTIQPAP